MEEQSQQIQIQAEPDTLKGRYANQIQILHTPEVFVLDFFNVFPSSGTLNGRVVINPQHMKRLARAIEENIKMYEQRFGSNEPNEEPKFKIEIPNLIH